MSLKSLEARKLATAGVVALSVLGAAASSAQADIQKKLEYTCKYPLVDKKPLTIDVTSNIPTYAKQNEQQPAFVVNAVATAKDGTSEAISTLDAYKLTGTSEARASLVFPSGFVQGNLKVPLTIDPYIRAANAPVPDPLVLTAKGQTPSVNLDELGKTDIRLDKISLNLAAFYDDGTPINVKKLATDFNGVAVTDSDGNINTFDVYCQLNAGESPIIATICVNATGTAAGGNCGTTPPANTPPTKVTGLKVDSKTSSSANLSWAPSTDAEGDAVSYNVYKAGVKVATVTTPSYAATGLTKLTTYAFDIEAVDAKAAAAAKTSISVTTDDVIVNNAAPSAPTGVKTTAVAYNSVALSWTASTDDVKVVGYNVYRDGVKIGSTTTGTTYTDSTATEKKTYSYVIEAYDAEPKATKSAALSVTTPAGPVVVNKAPSAPTGVKTTSVIATSVALSWTPSTDDVAVVGYNVYRDGVKIGTSTTTAYTDATTVEKKTYSYVIEAYDAAPLATKSAALSVTTPAGVIVDPTVCPRGLACYNYAAKGSTTLKTLVNGSLPLIGDIKAQLDVSTGKFLADLTLNNTSGRLTAAGFLPITAKVGFVPSGKTTGQLDDATATKPQSITTNSKVRIKILEVKLFGAIPLAGGNSCQTKSLSDITLKSTNAFDPLKGGAIGGTFTISDLNGCGALNGLVSPLTAGGGNTIALNLTKY